MKLNVLKGVTSKVFGYLFFDVSIKLMPFFILPYFSHTLSMSDFKDVSLFIVMLSFLLTLLPSGVSTKVLLKLTENSNNKLCLPSALLIPFLITILLLLFSRMLSEFISLNRSDVCYLILIAFNLTIGQVIAARYQAEQKSSYYGSIMLILQASFYIPIVYFISLDKTLLNTSSIFNSSIALQVVFILSVILFDKKSNAPRIRFSMSEVKLYSLFISGVSIHIIVNSTRFIYDRLFMASVSSDSEFVYYNIAMQVAMILSVLLVSINRYWSAFYFANKKSFRNRYYFLGVFFMFSAAISVYFFGRLYISWFYPPDYISVLYIMPFLIASYFFQGLYFIFSVKLYSEENFKAINFSSSLSLMLSVVMMPKLYSEFGTSGVAMSVLISWSSLFFLSLIFILKSNLKTITKDINKRVL